MYMYWPTCSMPYMPSQHSNREDKSVGVLCNFRGFENRKISSFSVIYPMHLELTNFQFPDLFIKLLENFLLYFHSE